MASSGGSKLLEVLRRMRGDIDRDVLSCRDDRAYGTERERTQGALVTPVKHQVKP